MAPLPDSGQSTKSTQTSLRITLGLVSVVAVFIGIWQIRNSIRMPFVYTPQSVDLNQSEPSTLSPEDASIEELKTKDTDKDGLSDYDETYIYHTSPYLRDTDSDGFDDKTEIDTSHDPLCAADKICDQSSISGKTNTPGATNEFILPADNKPVPTPAEIREFLKKSGATDELLSKYDDESLLALYKELASESSANGSTSPSTTPESSAPPLTITPTTLTPEQKSLLQKMSAAELRNFLLSGGADKATLDKFDDASLQALVKKTLGL